MKKIFYFMHVHWGWVKQRPHFLAEALAKYYDVDVFFYDKIYKKDLLVDNKTPAGINVKELPALPPIAFPLISKINNILLKFNLRRVIKKYDIIWGTNPKVYEVIEDIIPDGATMIYDCMDNALEFPKEKKDAALRQKRYECEKRLIDKSDLIFTSSLSLKQTLIKRYDLSQDKTIAVVHNAISIERRRPSQPLRSDIENVLRQKKFKLTYIGTISDWVDFDLIIEALNKFQDAIALFFGPLQTTMPGHDRIFHFGPIAHECIYRVMEGSDALFMPFKVDELILGVDPVKLYEYIYSCKPVIAVNYPETAKFGDYVHLYSGLQDFCDILRGIIEGERGLKKSCEEYRAFAESNTWEKRSEYIHSLIR